MPDVVTLDEFKRYVNHTRPGVDDVDLQSAITLAVAHVEAQCGPILTATVTAELSRAPRTATASRVLRYRIAALTSLASYPSGTALTLTDYRADGRIVSRKDGGTIGGDLTVTYSTGAATAPVWAKGAVLACARQFWRTVLRPNPAQPAPEGFFEPRMATELMAPYLLLDGLA